MDSLCNNYGADAELTAIGLFWAGLGRRASTLDQPDHLCEIATCLIEASDLTELAGFTRLLARMLDRAPAGRKATA